MTIQLMTDGGADIPSQLFNVMDLLVVPLYLRFKDEEIKGNEIASMNDFYEKIKEAGELPKTSAPSPNDFYKAFKSVDPAVPIIMLSISKGLSATYNHALTAKNMLLEEEPERKIAVINTKTASCGMALLLIEANLKIKEQLSFEKIVPHLQTCVEKTVTLFALQTLDNLILGGRLDKVKGTIAKTLNIKLLMRANDEDGTVEVIEKVRGNKKTIRRFIEQIQEYIDYAGDRTIVMTHCNAKQHGKNVLEEIKQTYSFKNAYLTDTGPLISTYSGEGALVISFFRK
ncbi:DegV family protein [Virgibacillus sp. W0430]|uniref:DegV family protein n=1 Tax=Virgibacillus sp. W0430 TaxID=3391580 RepID=UPI003F467BAD